MFARARAALSLLICTNQFVPIPNEENWVVQLKEFGLQLGDTPDRREQALQHMLRVFAWNTKKSSNHQNHVTALHLFLERLNACWDVKAEPWNMRELKQKPLWLEANSKIITRDPHANDADVCQYDQYTLDTTHDPEAQPMGYLTLPSSGGRAREARGNRRGAAGRVCQARQGSHARCNPPPHLGGGGRTLLGRCRVPRQDGQKGAH